MYPVPPVTNTFMLPSSYGRVSYARRLASPSTLVTEASRPPAPRAGRRLHNWLRTATAGAQRKPSRCVLATYLGIAHVPGMFRVGVVTRRDTFRPRVCYQPDGTPPADLQA